MGSKPIRRRGVKKGIDSARFTNQEDSTSKSPSNSSRYERDKEKRKQKRGIYNAARYIRVNSDKVRRTL